MVNYREFHGDIKMKYHQRSLWSKIDHAVMSRLIHSDCTVCVQVHGIAQSLLWYHSAIVSSQWRSCESFNIWISYLEIYGTTWSTGVCVLDGPSPWFSPEPCTQEDGGDATGKNVFGKKQKQKWVSPGWVWVSGLGVLNDCTYVFLFYCDLAPEAEAVTSWLGTLSEFLHSPIPPLWPILLVAAPQLAHTHIECTWSFPVERTVKC